MGRIRWYKRDPDAALAGMMILTLEERGAYNTILDLIYSHGGELCDDQRFIAGWLRCDVRVWKRIRARLIDLKKLYLQDGVLRNSRADAEVDEALSRVLSARHAARTKWHTSQPISEAVSKENKAVADAPAYASAMRPHMPRARATTTTREEEVQRSTESPQPRAKETNPPRCAAEDPIRQAALGLIQAFDAAQKEAFGDQRRQQPNGGDLNTCLRWARQGLSPDDLTFLAATNFAKIAAQGRSPPTCCKYLDGAVHDFMADGERSYGNGSGKAAEDISDEGKDEIERMRAEAMGDEER